MTPCNPEQRVLAGVTKMESVLLQFYTVDFAAGDLISLIRAIKEVKSFHSEKIRSDTSDAALDLLLSFFKQRELGN